MRAQPTQVGGILGMAGTRFGWMHDAGFSDMWVEYLAGPDRTRWWGIRRT